MKTLLILYVLLSYPVLIIFAVVKYESLIKSLKNLSFFGPFSLAIKDSLISAFKESLKDFTFIFYLFVLAVVVPPVLTFPMLLIKLFKWLFRQIKGLIDTQTRRTRIFEKELLDNIYYNINFGFRLKDEDISGADRVIMAPSQKNLRISTLFGISSVMNNIHYKDILVWNSHKGFLVDPIRENDQMTVSEKDPAATEN